jgi:P pilus assembly chaperone PapD
MKEFDVLLPMKRLKCTTAIRTASAALVAFILSALAPAQTIRPVLMEYTAKVAKGSVELVNPGVIPLTVIMEPKSFTVAENGDISYRPLDKDIHIKMSATSFQIPPQQSHFVFYEASADALPAWFVLYADIGGYHKTDQGLNIRLDLPHTVYILPKHSVSKSDLVIKQLALSPDKTKLRFEVANTGPLFGRVLAAQLTGKEDVQGSGFPVFPNSKRIIEVPCMGDQTKASLRLRLKNFTIEQPLHDPSGAAGCAP